MAAGLVPDDFWNQSPATFNAAMRGAALAARQRHEMAMAGAWWGEFFHREKRMGPLSKYTAKLRGDDKNKAADLVASFAAMQGRGLNISVRKVPRDGD